VPVIHVEPALLRWARERAALDPADLARRVGLKLGRIEEWEETGNLEFAHLERLAQKTHTPVGYLFLPAPPVEMLPISDFRRPQRGGTPRRPSPELLDTIRQCQQRQAWYREYQIAEGAPALPFVRSATMQDAPATVAADIRAYLDLDQRPVSASVTWTDALGELFGRAEALGVLVMRNGVVGNNTHRPLDVEEFRGFALSDPYAPLVFVNAADAKAAQMFTFAHELGHLWLGASAVSDADPDTPVATERFCNAVAAEVLVPADAFRTAWNVSGNLAARVARLSHHFKVSGLVILIRAREAGLLGSVAFEAAYQGEVEAARAREERPGSGGGNFYNTQGSRLGDRFAAAVITSTLEGGTSYTEAFRLLGFKRSRTFDEYARSLGVLP